LSDKQGKTRREVLADAAKAAAAASVAGIASCFPKVGGEWPRGPQCGDPDAGAGGSGAAPRAVTPAVVEVQREDSLLPGSRSNVDPAVVTQMLDEGLAALASQVRAFASGAPAMDGGAAELASDSDNPWPTLLPSYQPGHRIGIKLNCLGIVAPSPALVRALIASLRDKLGVDPGNILVWDRFVSDLASRSKLKDEDLAGARMIGNLLRGADEEKGETVDDPALTNGIGYGDKICTLSRKGKNEMTGLDGDYARVSRVVTHETDLTINCLSFKTHNISGVTGAIKSVYGIIHNPGEYHREFHDVAAELYAIPAVRNSMPLTICDAIVGLSSGDPTGYANCWPKRVLLAQDPVAMDSYIIDLMNQVRGELSGPLDPRQLLWIDKAAELGLGTRNYQLVQV
jgi:hypothetical protein